MTMFFSSLNSDSKRKTFDAIRGLAVLFVLFTHLDNYRILYLWPWSAQPIQGFIGRSGVFLFFLLSGYLIWSSARNQLSLPSGVKHYFINRFTRIYPLYVVCILTIIALEPLFIGYKKPDVNLNTVLRHLFFLQSFSPEVSGSLNGPFWTLTHEFIFYLLVPIIFYLKRLNQILILSIVITQIAWQQLQPNLHAFVNYWCLFSIGILTCINQQALNKFTSVSIMFISTILFIVYPKAIIFQMLFSIGLFHLLINFKFENLLFRPLVGLGIISYSVYVWHYVVIRLVAPYVKNVHPLIPKIKPWLPSGLVLESLLLITLILLFSILSYLIIEKPSMTVLRNKLIRYFI